MTLRLIWRNLFRNRRRSLITMASVAFAVLLAITFRSLQMGVFRNLIRNVAGMHTGYLQIHLNGYQEEPTLENSFRFDSLESILRSRTDTLYPLLPRLESFALISGDSATKGAMVIGTEGKAENRLTGIERRIIGGEMPESGELLIAEGLAKDLRVGTGDTVVILGQGYEGSIAAGKYAVSGIVHFATPALNSGLVYLPLPAAQELFSAYGRLTSAVVILESDKDLETVRERIATGIGSAYEAVTWKEMMPDIENHIQADTVFFFIEIGVLYIVIAFGIFGTLIMMMNERKRENSMLLAVGMKRGRLGWTLFVETVLLGGIGALAGMLLSLPLVSYLTWHPIRFSGRTAEVFAQFGFEPIFPATVDPMIFLQQALIVFSLSVLLGGYPLISTLRMDPLNSLRNA